MPDTENKFSLGRGIALGVFLILFGLIIGVLAFATVVAPIFGLLLVALGIYLIWTAAVKGDPPKPME